MTNQRENATVLSPPAHLSAEAIEVWRAVVATMAEAKTLTAANLAAVERYAAAIVRWREAQAHVTAGGPVTLAPRTSVPMISPWLSIARAAASEASSLEKELGLSPARRSRVTQARRSLRADGTRRGPEPWEGTGDE